MKQGKNSREISIVKEWLEGQDSDYVVTEDYVCNVIDKYNDIDSIIQKTDIRMKNEGKKNSLKFQEYINLIKLVILGEDSEVVKMQVIIDSNITKINDLEIIIATKDKEIEELKSKVVELEDSINIKDVNISCLESNLIDIKYKLNRLDTELECLREKKSNLNKGKKHIRGTEEFYRDVKIACSLICDKKNDKRVCKNGEPYKSYREAVAYAKECATIQNYAASNKVKINRENLKNWLSVAIALENGEEPSVSLGKYKANKGYKR